MFIIGKGRCDTSAAVYTNKITKEVNTRMNATNAEEACLCLANDGGISGSRFFHGTMKLSQKGSKLELPHVTELFTFLFTENEDGMVVHRYGRLGKNFKT